MKSIRRLAPCFVLLLSAAAARGDEIASLVATLKAAQAEGVDSEKAAQAWKSLAAQDGSRLPDILAGLDGAGPLGANWIGSAADAVAQRAIEAHSLPVEALEQYVAQRKHAPRGRRLAYEWLVRVDSSISDRLLPNMLDDPSLELRREAVARLVKQAETLPPAKALPSLRRALGATRDMDQLQQIAGRMDKLGEKVDLARQLGCLTHWKIIGPWDNTDGKGFDAVYPPERDDDSRFARTYSGKPDKDGKARKLAWIDHVAAAPLGQLDFNRAFGEEKSVVAYAAAVFNSPGKQDVEVRCGSNNALRIWVNGRPVGQFELYHAGGQFDEFICKATLQPGRNVILFKVCQNAQTQPFANTWGLQARICDPLGGGLPSNDRPTDKKIPTEAGS